MLYFRTILLCVLALLISDFAVLAAPLSLSKDVNGWTVFAPSSDSRIIYISETGSDTTCTYYLPSAVGGDVNNPSGVTPCSTYKKALSLAREGYPDWILFRRGETFTIDSTNSGGTTLAAIVPTSGRGATEPALTGAYGTSGASPVVQIAPGVGQAVRVHRAYPNWIALTGIDFYSYTRDPANAGYIAPTGDQLGLYIYSEAGTTDKYNGIAIEGCKFRYFDDNMVSSVNLPVPDLSIRRNLFFDGYAGTGQSHNQGLYTEKQNPLIEENIFIHNGWLVPFGGGVGEATTYNHSVYSSSPIGGDFLNNISIVPSSIHFKMTGDKYVLLGHGNTSPIDIVGNLCIDGQIGVQFGSNVSGTVPFENVNITDNVFSNIGRSKLIQGISWGVDIQFDTDGAVVSDNLFMNQDDATINNGNFIFDIAGILSNIEYSGNVAYNVKNCKFFQNVGQGGQSSTGSTKANITVSGNKYSSTLAGYFVSAVSISGITFSGNKYYGDRGSEDIFSVNSVAYSMSEWVTLSGDTSTFSEPTFPDPTRSIETYMTSIGEAATIDAFIAKCRAQDRYNWDTRFTAPVVNAYLRAGFFSDEPGPVSHLGRWRNFRFVPAE